jgi:hypothetical protein
MLDRSKLEEVWKKINNTDLNSLERAKFLGLNPEEADALIERGRKKEMWLLAFAYAALELMRSPIDRTRAQPIRRHLHRTFEELSGENFLPHYYETASKKIKAAAEEAAAAEIEETA